MDAQHLANAPVELSTDRLRLLAPRPEFALPFVQSLNRSLPELHFIAFAQRERTPEWGHQFLARDLHFWAKGECLAYYAFEKASGEYVGRIDLHSWDFSTPRCEVGYVGDTQTAGRGLMREAVLACVELAFTLGAARVQALSEAGNLRALRFAEHALGFVREGVLRNYERDAQGKLGQQVMFAVYNPQAR